MPAWQLQEAKNRFSGVVGAALAGEHREVTRNVRDFVPAGVRFFNPFEVRRGTVRMKRGPCERSCVAQRKPDNRGSE